MRGGDTRGKTAEDDDVDHYAVLGLPSGEEGSNLTLKEIERAYRNQSRIRHPDKRPEDPNATADFQRLTSSFEVLRDEASRRIFYAKLRSRRERILRDSLQDAKRRKMATDLEDRERAAATAVDPEVEARRKEKMKADVLKREIAEFLVRHTEKDSQSFTGRRKEEEKVGASLDKERVLKISWETGAGDYGAVKLREIFERFGAVEDVVIRSKGSKKKGSAIVVMASKGAAVAATQAMSGDLANPLLVLPVEPIVAGTSSTFTANNHERSHPQISRVVGAGFQDYEASILQKLQKANEKKKSMQ